jgi:peptidoglycan/LPS O-acetylase OafA/YrhL
MSLERSSGPERSSRPVAFYTRRAFRIYPLAILTVVAVAALRLPAAPWVPRHSLHWPTLIANVLLVQNISGHESIPKTLWSLPFEVQMYILLPWLFAIRTKVRPASQWLTALSLAMLALWAFPAVGEVIRYFPCFCAGMVAWQLLRSGRLCAAA